MRKLRLDPETLSVETFDATSTVDAERGTVRGRSWGLSEQCFTRLCTPEGTCGTSCDPNQACDCRYTYNVTCDVGVC